MYKKTKAPWIKWDPSVFLANTRGMNFLEIGIYTFLSQHFYLEGCVGLAQDYMVYLFKINRSNNNRLSKFKEKFPNLFVNGSFYCKSIAAALEDAKERKANSINANKIKKEIAEGKKLNSDNKNQDLSVAHKDKDNDREKEKEKEIYKYKELEVDRDINSLQRDERMRKQYPYIFKKK